MKIEIELKVGMQVEAEGRDPTLLLLSRQDSVGRFWPSWATVRPRFFYPLLKPFFTLFLPIFSQGGRSQWVRKAVRCV